MTETEKTEKTDISNAVALWMIRHGYATGHGDTVEDMLGELEAQAKNRGISQYLGTRP